MNKKLKNWFLNSSVSDSNADAYFAAAGITSTTEKAAWTATVIALKAAGLYTGNIFYPLLGTTASQKKYNAVDPRDLDAANRLNLQGSWTYNTSGMLGDGSTTFGDTFFNPSTSFNGSSGAFGFGSLTSAAAGSYDMASGDGVGTKVTCCIARYTGDIFYSGFGTAAFTCGVANTDGKGFFAASRKDGTTTEGYKSGLLVKSVADTATASVSTIYIGGLNVLGTNNVVSSRLFSFAFIIPLGLTQAQHLTFYNIINTNFLTPLGRV